MQRVGVEPTKALSHKILSLAPLTTRESLLKYYKKSNNCVYKNLYKELFLSYIEDNHNSLVTPVLIPNTEVKQAMLLVLVSEMK